MLIWHETDILQCDLSIYKYGGTASDMNIYRIICIINGCMNLRRPVHSLALYERKSAVTDEPVSVKVVRERSVCGSCSSFFIYIVQRSEIPAVRCDFFVCTVERESMNSGDVIFPGQFRQRLEVRCFAGKFAQAAA